MARPSAERFLKEWSRSRGLDPSDPNTCFELEELCERFNLDPRCADRALQMMVERGNHLR